MNRKVDTSKKSNIKCEHCEYWDRDYDDHEYDSSLCAYKFPCNMNHGYKAYWNRCKDFEWKMELK